MKGRPWIEYWFEHYFATATLVTESSPLMLGWCIYVEPIELD